MTLLTAGLLLALKHFVCDGPLQTPYQYRNKGSFGHPGGILHSGLHALATVLIFLPLDMAWLGCVDFVVHYLVDLLKVKATARFKWSRYGSFMGGPADDKSTEGVLITSDWYFYALMLDQCLHFATYVVFLAVVFG